MADESFSAIAITVVLTTIGTAAVSYITHHLTQSGDDAQRERAARYGAMRIVLELDRFITQCSDIVQYDHNESIPGTTPPSRPVITYPNDIEWRVLEPKLMYRALDMLNELERADAAVSTSYEISTPPDYVEFDEAKDEFYSSCGQKALALTRDCRAHYQLPPTPYEKDAESAFENALQRVHLTQRRRRDLNEQIQMEYARLTPSDDH